MLYQIEGGTSLTNLTGLVEGPLVTAVIPPALPSTPPAGYQYLTFRLAGSNGLPGKGFLRAKALPASP